jgi:hypothetical protein
MVIILFTSKNKMEVRLIFEFLVELSEVNTLYAIYTGVILGLALKYFWSLNCEYWESSSFLTYENDRNIHSPTIVLKSYCIQSNLIFNWIIQVVRRKKSTLDETDSFLSY